MDGLAVWSSPSSSAVLQTVRVQTIMDKAFQMTPAKEKQPWSTSFYSFAIPHCTIFPHPHSRESEHCPMCSATLRDQKPRGARILVLQPLSRAVTCLWGHSDVLSRRRGEQRYTSAALKHSRIQSISNAYLYISQGMEYIICLLLLFTSQAKMHSLVI